MKAEPEIQIDESGLMTDQEVADPFAVDLFARRAAPAAAAAPAPTIGEPAIVPFGAAWHSRLPRLSADQVRASASLAAMPAEFYGQASSAFARVMANYASVPLDEVSIAPIELRETELSPDPTELRLGPRAFMTVSVEPGANPFVIELEARFASRLIDLMLGGDGSAPDSLRPLSKAECAVVEFLCLGAIDELNREIGEPLARLDGVTESRPSLGAPASEANRPAGGEEGRAGRGLMVGLRVSVGRIVGLAYVYLSAGALTAFDAARRQLIAARPGSATSESAREKVARAARIAPEVSLNIAVGKTELTSSDLTGLEWGDVVVVERPSVVWRDGRLSGNLSVRVGDGDGSLILGRAETARGARAEERRSAPRRGPKESEEAPQIRMVVGMMAVEKARTMAERLEMEQRTEGDETAAEGAALVDGVMLTVHVELAARRLRVDELLRLRANQIIDLGCKATDPVDLIVDGRRVARGELVDIEGRLGVRITQLSV